MRQFVVFLIRVYQLALSPLLGNVCRFEPSCSRYAMAVVERFGVLRGSVLAAKRIARCHPWNPGGYDPPPFPHDHAAHGSHARVLAPHSELTGGSH